MKKKKSPNQQNNSIYLGLTNGAYAIFECPLSLLLLAHGCFKYPKFSLYLPYKVPYETPSKSAAGIEKHATIKHTYFIHRT